MYLCCVLTQDFYDYCEKENLTSPEQLPYFEGDFWPIVIEEQIKELDHELEEERKAEAEEADVSVGWGIDTEVTHAHTRTHTHTPCTHTH